MDIDALISAALREDLGSTGDITSRALFSGEDCRAALFSKDSGVLAGSEVFSKVFATVDQDSSVDFLLHDGDFLNSGDRVAVVEGKTASVLTAERTAINFLSYLTGIATETRRFVTIVASASGTTGKTAVLDTRKTLPGYRKLAKYAVTVGGGRNHRMGLYDMVMIKDNHIDAAGSISEAVSRVRRAYGDRYKIEVECRCVEDVQEAVAAKADIVMLDNMDLETSAAALELRKGDVLFEVSGNMNLEKAAAYAGTGVDFISVGALTHSVRAFDYSLKIN
jgi:nicotinate-nucleotide pyrophosphorylase (carboxylating)